MEFLHFVVAAFSCLCGGGAAYLRMMARVNSDGIAMWLALCNAVAAIAGFAILAVLADV